jgi:hypothetical protein
MSGNLPFVVCLSSILLAGFQKPPKIEYDKKRDLGSYSTGDVQTGPRSGFSAHFDFPGKVAVRPKEVEMGVGSLRPNLTGTESDVLKWQKLSSVSIKFDGQTVAIPATESHQATKNTMATILYGDAVEESMGFKIPVETFLKIAQASSVVVVLGNETFTIKGKSLQRLRSLANSIPAP